MIVPTCESELTSSDLPPEVAERLGPYYVYVLVDPTDESVFYVGKGSKQQLLAHGREADLAAAKSTSGKVRRIRAIREAEHEPRVDIVRHSLDESQALLIEAALIDALKGLTNSSDGHGAERGRYPLSEYVSPHPDTQGSASRCRRPCSRADQGRPVARHGRGDGAGGLASRQQPPAGHLAAGLIDSARGWWRISPETIQERGIGYAVAVYDGVTRLVMEIGGWTQRDDGRRAFTATPVMDGPIFDAWVGPLGKRVTFRVAARNPIACWHLKPGRTHQ